MTMFSKNALFNIYIRKQIRTQADTTQMGEIAAWNISDFNGTLHYF